MSETMHIVFGEAGSYSEWNQWAVAAYRNEPTAQKHVEGAEAARRLRYELKTKAATDILDAWDEHGAKADAYSLRAVELRDVLPDAPLERMQEGLQRGKAS